MADLNDIAVFVKVAQLESFSRAARALGMPVSTVSRKVTSLEDQLGVTLMQRTTRKLSLTAQGRAYYNQCSEPLSHLFDAESALTQTQKKPEGLLRISVPVIMGQEPFYEFLSAFLKKYPRIQVDLFITNLFVDLVADNVDVAIRFGELAGFDHHRKADREERSLSRRFTGLSERPNSAGKARRPSEPSMRPAQRPKQRGGMASGQWSKISEAACLWARVEPGFPKRQRLHLQGARHWSSAVELLRRGNQETRSRSHLTGVVIARRFSSKRSIRHVVSFHPNFRFSSTS